MVPARMVLGLALPAAAIHGCWTTKATQPAPATVTVRTPVLAVRPKVKPSMRAAIVIATALGRNIPAVSTGAKPIAGTAAHPSMTMLRTV